MTRFLHVGYVARNWVALILTASFFIYSGCKSETESVTSPINATSGQAGGSAAAKTRNRAEIRYLGGQEERKTRGSSGE